MFNYNIHPRIQYKVNFILILPDSDESFCIEKKKNLMMRTNVLVVVSNC